ncbi:MAG: hypothetical protein NUW01_06150 [Gemmatimonadaceae bacterium]|nr:hypothetical protein [Gemmatimonadaceae bacterium]
MTLHRPSSWPSIGTAAMVAVLAGCSSVADPPFDDVPPNVVEFVTNELPKPRQIDVEFRDDGNGLLIFSASYGEPQDCPAGCFYLMAWGLAYRDQVGWIGLSVPTGTTSFYDVKPEDSQLFADQLWDDLKPLYVFGAFRMMLTCDADTPASALVRLAERLPQEGWPFLASLLLNEAQRRDVRPVAEVIARLVSSEWNFTAPRERAALVLNDWPGVPLSGLDCPRR